MASDGSMVQEQGAFIRHLTKLDAWSLCLGCAVGWGAFVMPGSTLIPMAGPLGSILAMVVGALAMAVIGRCYTYAGRRYGESGGAFSYTAHVFGHDHAFLCGWTIGLAYVAILWANATSVVLIARFLLGPVLQVGYCWQIAGYDVYLGEIAVTIAVIVLFGLLSCLRSHITRLISTALALMLLGGTLACALLIFIRVGFSKASLSPAFASQDKPFLGVMGVVVLAPWAFVGFESVTNASEELDFAWGDLFRVVLLGLAASGAIYVTTTLMSVMVIPEGYATWMDYFNALGSLDGVQALPVFNAVNVTTGTAGFRLLGITVLSGITSSLLGLYRATSRLIYYMAKEGILKERFLRLDKWGTPINGVLMVMALSLFVPFVGRAAIGWIVDVTSVCATIAYLYVCACAHRIATEEQDRGMVVCARVGLAISGIFFVLPLVPNFWSVSALASESYFILSAWAILGVLLFYLVLRRDQSGRFGKSVIVWIALLSLIFFSSTMWMRQTTNEMTEDVVAQIDQYHEDLHAKHNVPVTLEEEKEEDAFVSARTNELRDTLLNNSLVQLGLIGFSLYIMFNIYSIMGKRQTELEAARLSAEETSRTKSMFLSNVSHDIRTPMNAVVGYTRLAQDEGLTLEETRAYLEKIDAASTYMVSLVNDVLEMGRAENGRMVLHPSDCDLREIMGNVADVFSGQMSEKGLAFTVDTSLVQRTFVHCDKDRLNSVLLNLVSNAYKFTNAGGSVTVSLVELGDMADGRVAYELTVRDTGIGMSEEFQERLFDPFEREQNTTVSGIQGTGLGMSITKSIVDLMGGSINVGSAPGEGTEFVILLPLELVGDGKPVAEEPEQVACMDTCLGTRRILMAEDNEINREIAIMVLEDMGLTVDTVVNGREAVERLAASEPGYYDAVLMDVQMPIMNGYEATRAIRQLENDELARIPIIAITANAFDEDIQEARNAGMDAHLAKPLDVEKVEEVLKRALCKGC